MTLVIDSLYRYSGEILHTPTVIRVIDHHYDETTNTWPLQQLLDASAIDPFQHTLIFDMNIHDDIFAKYKPICAPEYLAQQVKDFESLHIVPDWTGKNTVFNFMINKLRPHRARLLEIIKNLKLTNFTYSLPWLENTITDLPVTNYMIGSETQMPQGIKSGSIRNCETYKYLLQKNVFEPSCISLITEPSYIEKEALLSEKTIMALYGGTIPIWVGGWRCAEALHNLGFDIFNDIVNHDYQTISDPWDRVEKAIYLNVNILQDFTVNDSILSRLRHNYDLMISGVFKNEVQKQLKGIKHA